ncbi:MAG: hypothetical protein Q4F34_02895, partial [Prevotellaceae bacterium]|nr:hypothetical protein [Prevotellaceae bacterium]
MKNVYKLMLLVAVMMLSVTANAHKKSIHKIAPQLTTCQRMMMKKAKPAKNKKAIARNFFQMNNRNGGLIKKAAAPKNATIDIVATNLSTADYSMWFEEYGYYMWASTDAYEVSLWVNTTKFAGKYTTSDVDTDYSYIADAENAYAITSINITCSESNGAQTITGTAVCEDGNTYKLNLTYVKPTKTSEETITISDGLLYDETSSEEYFEAAGMNASNTRYVQVCVYSDKVAGTYTTDDCDTYYTFIAKVGNRDTTYYDLVDADLKVTMVDETTAKITGTLLCQSETDPNDVPEFTISMTCEVEGGGSDEGLDYDAMSDDFNATFTADDDVLVDDSYFNAYNVLYIDATTADGKKSIGLEFNVSEKDNQIVIPEGVYQITSGYGEGTVTASEGVDEEGYITYSFAGTLDEDGAFEDPMWFMVGGTVTVTNDNGKLKVVVDAVNSYGCEVTSTITTGTSVTPDPTPGENLVQNGSFEEWTSDSQPTGWEGWQITEYGNSGGAVLSRTTDHHEGSYACLVAGDAKSNKRLSTGKMTLKAGKYYVQFYAKAVSGEGAIKPGYATKQANGDAAYTYIYGDDCIALSSSWKKISYDFTLKANTDIAMVVMNYKNSGDCIIDDYKLWLDGSAPDTIPTPITDDIYTIDFT